MPAAILDADSEINEIEYNLTLSYEERLKQMVSKGF